MINIQDEQETIVFVPGMFAGGWMWDQLSQRFDGHKQYRIDKPLCAVSHKLEEMTDKLAEDIEANTSGPLALVSNSLGSLISLKLASRLSDSVKKVVISGSAGFGKVDLGVKITRDDPIGMASKLMKLVFFDNKKIPDYAVQMTGKNFRDYFKQIILLSHESNKVQIDRILSNVDCQVLAIWGDHDVFTPAEQIASCLDKYGIPLRTIENSGHSPMFESPDKFANHVKAAIC